MNYELLIGLRYTRAQPREGVANRFISFIALISMPASLSAWRR
jgi:ABC-type lipoprotein release transport system permease subunit